MDFIYWACFVAVSPDTPNLPNELMNNDHSSGGGGYARVQQHGLPLTKTDLSTATAQCPTRQQKRPTLSPWFVTIFWVDYSRPHPSWKRQHFVLIEIDTLQVDLPFLLTAILTNPPSMDLKNTLFTVSVFHTTLLLAKQLILQKMGLCSWSSLILPSPLTLGAGLIGWWDVLLKTQLQHHLGGESLEGGDVEYALNC